MRRLMEQAEVPFVGSDAAVAELCSNKVVLREALQESGFPIMHQLHFKADDWTEDGKTFKVRATTAVLIEQTHLR
jgi:D-alanine-D-alanine ligase-like ATP-grasp enzyme